MTALRIKARAVRADTAGVTTVTTQSTTITHRYPWTLEEQGSIAVLVAGPALVAALFGWWGESVPLAAGVTLAGLLAAGALFRLGHRRKKRSTVTGMLTGTRLVVSGGRVGSSRGDVATTRTGTTLELGPETVLVLGSRDGTSLRVPMRLTTSPELREVLRTHLLHDGVDLTDHARDLVADL